jgi:flagellar biosynthetic protein FliP
MINKRRCLQLVIIIALICIFASSAYAEPTIPVPKVGITVDSATTPQETASSIQVLLIITVLALAPSILIMMTSFTRIIIVLSFLRNALGTQQMPPNQVLIGLALFLSLFIMSPVINDINTQAFQPYQKGTISQETALQKSSDVIKGFMFKYTRNKDLALFLKLSQTKQPINKDQIPTTALIPAFIISELKTAFMIGFFLYIPFLMIDMVVSSTLMSMGMMMLPPVMISLPFKILLLVMVDGWTLVSQMLVNSFAT